MKYNCLLVDDNPIELDLLESFVKKLNPLHIEAACSDPVEALGIMRSRPIDIVFSDIDMPELKGIEMLRSLKEPPVFVFISSHQEYALEGYELDVADYVLKPLSFPRFLKAADKAMEVCETRRMLKEKAAGTGSMDAGDDHFMIRTENSYLRIRFQDIDFIESMSNYSRIYTSDHKQHVVLASLKKIEESLPASGFIRTHRSYVVPVAKIEEIKPSGLRIGQHIVPVGASFREALMEKVVNKKLISRNTD